MSRIADCQEDGHETCCSVEGTQAANDRQAASFAAAPLQPSPEEGIFEFCNKTNDSLFAYHLTIHTNALAEIKADATAQLDQYSSDPALAAAWHLGTGTGSDKSVASPSGATFGEAALSPLHDGVTAMTLHRLVLVFHGGNCLLAEEV